MRSYTGLSPKVAFVAVAALSFALAKCNAPVAASDVVDTGSDAIVNSDAVDTTARDTASDTPGAPAGAGCDVGSDCASQLCVEHVCRCETGRTACAGACVDIVTDVANCGACGRACSGAQVCFSGLCARPENDLDLLLVIDNSFSMAENQANLLSQVSGLLDRLTNPPCTSATDPTPHACHTGDLTDHPLYQAVRSLHAGVVSTDLGTPGSSVPGCANSDLGDDGLLNPIRYGAAMAQHEPWASTPPASYPRPSDCSDPNEFPAFLFTTSSTDPNAFVHDFQCNAALYNRGCGLEAPLDAIYRALIVHDARETGGIPSPNAGFVRDSALLAIVVLTDEEDGSVRGCPVGSGSSCTDSGALDVYWAPSTAWASADLNLRFYLDHPCGADDPTWGLDRYVDPHDASAGILAVKPGHPERVVFGAITGVPIDLPVQGSGAAATIDWDRLLGTPGADRDDFCARDSTGLASLTSAEGPISMAQANLDPNCTSRVVPACRRAGSTFVPTGCTTADQYFAWPARRIVEIARRFDESPLCDGMPCHNGIVTSICGNDYASVLQPLIARLTP